MTSPDKYAELREAHRIFNELPIHKQIEYSQCPIWHKYSSLLLADLDKANQEIEQSTLLLPHMHVNNSQDDSCAKCGLDLRNSIHFQNPPTDKEQSSD